MFTYDNDLRRAKPQTELDTFRSKTPDRLEVGESNDYWIYVCRSKKQIELVSKQTGKTIAKCSVVDAAKYGLHEKQIAAAKKGLQL